MQKRQKQSKARLNKHHLQASHMGSLLFFLYVYRYT